LKTLNKNEIKCRELKQKKLTAKKNYA